MQELMLIATGVPMNRSAHAVADDGVAPLRLPWRGIAATAGDPRIGLLQRLGRADLAALSPAELLARAAGPNPKSNPWLLSPLHCVAGIDRLHVGAEGLLDVPAGQWAELCEGFVHELGAGGLTLTPVDGATALLEAAPFGGLTTVAPDELPGSDLRDLQPRGPDAARWRALQGEIEMWLHEHPVNRRRLRGGQAPVTTLWLWGGRATADAGSIGVTGAAASTAAVAPVEWVLGGLGAWARALATLQPGVRVADAAAATGFESFAGAHPGRALVARISAAPDGVDLERRWLAPAAQALERGELRALTLWHRGGSWRLHPRRWWRRRASDRTLAELFTAAPAAPGLR